MTVTEGRLIGHEQWGFIMERIIVVGVDGSETSKAAAQRAAEIAEALDARLHLVTSVEPTTTVDMTVGADVFHSDWVGVAEAVLADVIVQLPRDRVTRKVLRGDAARSVCQEAEEVGAQAIVVGNRRVSGVGRVLGSVAASVVRHAPCDVVVANTCRGRVDTRTDELTTTA